MQAVILSGSRNPEGQTGRAIGALISGLGEGGFQAETFFLPSLRIERCRQCEDNGWGICRREGRCAIEDDFEALVARIRAADVVVFATPVYWGDLSESLRAFLDRLRRITRHDAGKEGISGKIAAGICVAGGGGGGSYSCAANLDNILRICGFDVVDIVPVRRQNLEAKVPVLLSTGKWLATSPRSS
jgi:multimeric flavodoxin WrbA